MSIISDICKSIKVKTKLFILYSILIITLSTSLAIILPVILENEIIDEVKLSSIIITRMTAINIAPAMHFNDDEALIEALDATYINKQLEYIVIESRDEKIIYSDIKSDLNKSDYKIGQKLEISPKGMIIKTSEVIFIDDIELGKLYIGFSMVDHKQQILKFQQMIIAMSAAILFVGLITSWLISNFFVKPLAEITKVMKSIGDHNLSERVELHTNDEIGELAASFNNMVDKLEKAVGKTKELNLSLSEKADELSATVATKDKFFSIIAHDLRGPLGGFRNVTRLLQNIAYEFSMDEVKQFIEILKDSSDKVYALLENLLEWSKSEQGIVKYEPEKLNLFSVIRNTADMYESSARAKNIQFNLNIPGDIHVCADLYMLNSILRNIISNAVKFSNVGGRIDIGLESDKFLIGHNEFVKIYVQDYGVGLSREIITKLFKVDEKITSQGTKGEKGTGLGLIICNEFILRHGGKINIESEEGKGTKFIFDMPAV